MMVPSFVWYCAATFPHPIGGEGQVSWPDRSVTFVTQSPVHGDPTGNLLGGFLDSQPASNLMRHQGHLSSSGRALNPCLPSHAWREERLCSSLQNLLVKAAQGNASRLVLSCPGRTELSAEQSTVTYWILRRYSSSVTRDPLTSGIQIFQRFRGHSRRYYVQ